MEHRREKWQNIVYIKQTIMLTVNAHLDRYLYRDIFTSERQN